MGLIEKLYRWFYRGELNGVYDIDYKEALGLDVNELGRRIELTEKLEVPSGFLAAWRRQEGLRAYWDVFLNNDLYKKRAVEVKRPPVKIEGRIDCMLPDKIMRKYVILQEDDYGTGIGYAFKHNEKEGRIAVIIKGEVNYEKLSKTFKFLHKELKRPEDSKHVVWGEAVLTGNEVKYDDIIKEEKTDDYDA